MDQRPAALVLHLDLETPRQNFAYSTYGKAIQAIPGAFQKRRTGLENQMGSIGPMALYSAVSGGALENVDSDW